MKAVLAEGRAEVVGVCLPGEEPAEAPVASSSVFDAEPRPPNSGSDNGDVPSIARLLVALQLPTLRLRPLAEEVLRVRVLDVAIGISWRAVGEGGVMTEPIRVRISCTNGKTVPPGLCLYDIGS